MQALDANAELFVLGVESKPADASFSDARKKFWVKAAQKV
ncbi:hypothetical protein FACS1894187_00430 [Synergistales bacterium]|nr:hypothetical protein FACS1894187_00430 [Synergistales bacterium]